MKGPGSGRPPAGGGADDRYEALLEVLEHDKAQQQADRELEERQRKRGRGSRVPIWLPVVLLGLVAWVWLFPPSFLSPEPPPPQPIEQEEAALRFAIYVQAQRIQAFRDQHGRYPETLDEAGPPLEGMRYIRLRPDLYQLTGTTDRVTLTYRSDLPLSDFVGSGADVLDEDRVP